jgi:hypothetical protein
LPREVGVFVVLLLGRPPVRDSRALSLPFFAGVGAIKPGGIKGGKGGNLGATGGTTAGDITVFVFCTVVSTGLTGGSTADASLVVAVAGSLLNTPHASSLSFSVRGMSMNRSNVFRNLRVELPGYLSMRSMGRPKYDTMLT